MSFSELPPSKQWAALKYRGEKFAEVWFKPEGEPFALTFRIPRESFQIPGMDQGLTTENLLKAVAIAAEDVDSWRHGDVFHSGLNGPDSDLSHPLPPPSPDDAYLDIYVSLRPPVAKPGSELSNSPQVDSPDECSEPGIPSVKWQDLETRWRAIGGVEATIDHLRLTMESMLAQMETTSKTALTTEEKLHALKADLAHWSKAKNRVPFAVPKVREFIHRATWVMGTPERKKLEELFKNETRPDIPLPGMIKLADQLENLLKDRQILHAQGITVHQECKTISTDIQVALRTLQSNAAANADRKRRAARAKGKFFKDIRRWTGAE